MKEKPKPSLCQFSHGHFRGCHWRRSLGFTLCSLSLTAWRTCHDKLHHVCVHFTGVLKFQGSLPTTSSLGRGKPHPQFHWEACIRMMGKSFPTSQVLMLVRDVGLWPRQAIRQELGSHSPAKEGSVVWWRKPVLQCHGSELTVCATLAKSLCPQLSGLLTVRTEESWRVLKRFVTLLSSLQGEERKE